MKFTGYGYFKSIQQIEDLLLINLRQFEVYKPGGGGFEDRRTFSTLLGSSPRYNLCHPCPKTGLL